MITRRGGDKLVQIPVYKNKDTFDRMNRKVGFINRIPAAIRENNKLFDDAIVGGWIIK